MKNLKFKIFGIVFVLLFVIFSLNFIQAEDFGSEDLNMSWETEPCVVNSANWNLTTAFVGTNAVMNVTTENCDGQNISFEVLNESGVVVNDTITALVNDNNKATAIWKTTAVGNYTFIAIASNEEPSDNNLIVIEPENCPSNNCFDYHSGGLCVGCGLVNSQILNITSANCSDSQYDCWCEWNDSNSFCEGVYNFTNISNHLDSGICRSHSNIIQPCDENHTIMWVNTTHTWTWNGVPPIPSIISIQQQNCTSSNSSTSYPCPVQLQLSLTSLFSAIATLVLIILIYFILLRKKGKLKKK